MGGALRYSWVTSVEEVGRATWERCFGTHDVYRSYALALATERARIEGIEHRYLLGRRGDDVLVLLPCFRFRLSLGTVADERVWRFFGAVERAWPRLFELDMFFVGPVLALCGEWLGLDPLPAEEHGAVLAAAKDEVLARAREERTGMVVLKEIRSHQLELVRSAFAPEFRIYPSVPTMFVPLRAPGYGGRLERMRSRHRTKWSRKLRKFHQAGLRFELEADFAVHAETFHQLYLNVLEHTGRRFETLTPDFFRATSELLGDDSAAMVAYDGERIVGFILLFADASYLQPIYLGMDYAYRDRAALYFNLLHVACEEAEARGYPVLELGQTAWEAKALMGGSMRRLHVAVHHRRALGRAAVHAARNWLFPRIPVPEHSVFREPEDALAILRMRGIEPEVPA
ncbi:MAG: GNAT family N-acetyltransferase [Planctomycetota bacterium]